MTNENDRRRDEETIVPVKPGFGAADAAAPSRSPEPRRGRPPLAAVFALVLLALLGVVFVALPRWVAEPAAESPQAAVDAPVALPPAEPELSAEEREALKTRAESQLAELLQQRNSLDAKSAARWGGEDWSRYDELSRGGDDALLAEDYRAAVGAYEAALAAGAALLERSVQIIDSALATAAAALAAGNARLAREQYDVVLGIEPQNPVALEGRARAQKLPEVLALVHDAERARQSGALEESAALYRQALAVDPQWSPAQSALDEVSAAIETARFESLLSRGYAALAEEEHEEAHAHFSAALEVNPESRPAADGLAQAEQGRKLDAIALSEARALAFERRELWEQAIERYETALAADPTLAFAIAGLERSQARADLDSKLENMLENPNLLLTDNLLVEARRLADEARALVEPDTRIGEQVARLDELIRIASTPIRVTLASDEQTEVAVYRVGMLGAFATTQIEVRPGTYTAVGSRDGYRDVRETFTVLPGRDVPTVRVICTEPIR